MPTEPHVQLPPKLRLDADKRDALIALAHSFARGGNADADYFLETAEDEHGIKRKHQKDARAIFDAVIAAWAALIAERESAGVLSNIDAAFVDLNAAGVVARGKFACCGNCANHEIFDEAPEGDWLGYVYFHEQDAERIPEEAGTYLGYGVNLPHYLSEEAWLAMTEAERDDYYAEKARTFVAESVTPTLERHGMSVTWDGDLGTRIYVEGITDYLVPLDLEE